MAIVPENIWCLGGEREPWAPPVFSNKYVDEESRMLNLKEVGEARGLQGEVTSHILQYWRLFPHLVFLPSHSPRSLEYFIP